MPGSNFSLHWDYDLANNIVILRFPFGRIDYTYDALNWVQTVNNPNLGKAAATLKMPLTTRIRIDLRNISASVRSF